MRFLKFCFNNWINESFNIFRTKIKSKKRKYNQFFIRAECFNDFWKRFESILHYRWKGIIWFFLKYHPSFNCMSKFLSTFPKPTELNIFNVLFSVCDSFENTFFQVTFWEFLPFSHCMIMKNLIKRKMIIIVIFPVPIWGHRFYSVFKNVDSIFQ